MLFAACTAAAPNPLQHTAHVANNLGQQQLTSLQQLKDQHAMSLSSSSSSSAMQTPAQMSPQHQVAATGNSAAAVAAAVAARANEEAKEAMRKLDATLVAYLAGETKLQSKQLEPELELDLNSQNESNVDDNEEYVLEEFAEPLVETVENITREELQLFRRIKSMKLQLEALTLEPEGTKRMELLQNDTRPIFTVECQLSHELIQNLPRYEMFHIMQFESEKFQSLTQCTRFGQEAQRDINLTPLIDELDNTLNGNGNGNAAAAFDAPNFGRIHFAVWWREPGTCLNEMLGMGVFELRELYDAALLEQCKRITIQRRGVPLANIYLKINLLLCTLADTNNNNNAADLSYEAALQAMKQQPGGGNKRKGGSGKSAAQSLASDAAAAANTSATSSNTTAKQANTKDNNNEKVGTSTGFKEETLKIRLLTGLICATKVKYLEDTAEKQFDLMCERFWRAQPSTANAKGASQFYYQEQFSILRDTNFLNHVRTKYLRILIYQHLLSKVFADGNGNMEELAKLDPWGLVLLPLQKFYIAFSNDDMANRMIKEKMPVISFDAWATIYGSDGKAKGEIKCLLAMGSEQQINELKKQRDIRPIHSDIFNNLGANCDNPLFGTIRMPTNNCKHALAHTDKQNSIRATVELMEMLQDALQKNHKANESNEVPGTSPSPPLATKMSKLSTETAPSCIEDDAPSTSQAAAGLAQPSSATCTTDAAVAESNKPMKKSLKFELTINCAVGLTLNPGDRCKPGSKECKRSISKRFPPGEPPSTYVTFQANDCVGSSGCYNSHEGNVYATKVVVRSLVPHWLQTFTVTVDWEYLTNLRKSFVLKLWKKANVPSANDSDTSTTTELVPTPNDDAIIGYTTLDLNMFRKGLHLAGVFNVFDFNGRITGRLELQAKPADDWYVEYMMEQLWQTTHKQQPNMLNKTITPAGAAATSNYNAATITLPDAAAAHDSKVDAEIYEMGKSLKISHLNLNEAVNIQYKDLTQISERLRARLTDVTGTDLSDVFNMDTLNDYQPLNELDQDVEMDCDFYEFQRDINDPSAAATDIDISEKSDKNEKNDLIKTVPGATDPAID
uniref:C2 domain-containing protein n=1 Tax=Bactrocera latifrons TaxID=174628 RepID=A0A0K8U4H0_BACLA